MRRKMGQLLQQVPAELVDLSLVELGGCPEPCLARPGHQAPAERVAVAVVEGLAAEAAGAAVEQEVLHLLVEDELGQAERWAWYLSRKASSLGWRIPTISLPR